MCHRNLEFLVDWPDEAANELDRRSAPLFVRGVIDGLWQDANGSWHLLAFTTAAAPAGEQEAYWQRRKAGLVLGAWAAQRRFGAWPRSLTLYFLREGLALTCGSRAMQPRKVLAAVEAALKEIAGLRLRE
jgi:hypothetical protein